jgi:hypothetical protein
MVTFGDPEQGKVLGLPVIQYRSVQQTLCAVLIGFGTATHLGNNQAYLEQQLFAHQS